MTENVWLLYITCAKIFCYVSSILNQK